MLDSSITWLTDSLSDKRLIHLWVRRIVKAANIEILNAGAMNVK